MLPRLRRCADASPVAHAIVLAVLFVAIISIGGWRTVASSDEGAYLVQSAQLDEGSWAVPYAQAADDPTYAHAPFFNAEVTDHGLYLFSGRIAYPALLAAVDRVGGIAAVRALVVAAGVAAALTAGLLARELGLGHRGAVLALWIAGLGPLLANSEMVWAHTLSAAAAGAAVVAAVRAARQPPAAALLTVGGLCLVGALLRTEGVLFAVAIAAVWAVAARGRARWPVAIGAAAGGGAGWLAQRLAWRAVKTGTKVAAANVTTDTSDRLHRLGGAIWHDLLSGGFLERNAEVVGFLGALLLVAALLLWRVGRDTGNVVLVVALVLCVVRIFVAPHDVASGFLAGFPAAAVAALGVRWSRGDTATRLVGLTAGAFVVIVLLTDYREGGGFQWAGRYLMPAVPAIAALAAVGLRDLGETVAASWKRATRAAAVAALLALPAMLAVTSLQDVRHVNDELVSAARSTGAPVIVTTVGSLPRLAWDDYPSTTYLLAKDGDDVGVALRLAARGDPAAIGLVGVEAPDLPGYEATAVGGNRKVWRYTRS